MAIYAFGASYEGSKDVSSDFIKYGVACVGWTKNEAPTLYAVLRHIRIGDIVYLKAHPPNVGLKIKAVGIVVNDEVTEPKPGLGWGVPVEWIWQGNESLGKIKDKYPIRNITLYEEHNSEVQTKVLNLLLAKIKGAPKKGN